MPGSIVVRAAGSVFALSSTIPKSGAARKSGSPFKIAVWVLTAWRCRTFSNPFIAARRSRRPRFTGQVWGFLSPRALPKLWEEHFLWLVNWRSGVYSPSTCQSSRNKNRKWRPSLLNQIRLFENEREYSIGGRRTSIADDPERSSAKRGLRRGFLSRW